jgi:hypothetical protein
MILKRVKATNSRAVTLDLPLEDISGGFVVQDIQGLGPVNATLVSSTFANLDGEQYHSGRREIRNLVVRMGLNPDYSQQSVYDLRSQLYQFFMPKSLVTLSFSLFDRFNPNLITQNLDVEIMGRIESFEPDVFSKDPAVELSILCFDPNFVDPDLITYAGSTVADLTEVDVEYLGSVETGVVFRLLVDRACSEFTLYSRQPDGTLGTIYFTHDLIADDVLEISSVFGDKYVRVTRAGVTYSILYAISPQSPWLVLGQGDNSLRVYSDGEAMPFELNYTRKYGGL